MNKSRRFFRGVKAKPAAVWCPLCCRAEVTVLLTQRTPIFKPGGGAFPRPYVAMIGMRLRGVARAKENGWSGPLRTPGILDSYPRYSLSGGAVVRWCGRDYGTPQKPRALPCSRCPCAFCDDAGKHETFARMAWQAALLLCPALRRGSILGARGHDPHLYDALP